MRKIGNTLTVAALAAALAPATQVAQAETMPTESRVNNFLEQSYTNLAKEAAHLAVEQAVQSNSAGRVAVTNNANVGLSGSRTTVDDLEVTSYLYSKSAHELEESVIDVYTPSSQASSTIAPGVGSLFQIFLVKERYAGTMPKTPDTLQAAMNQSVGGAAGEYMFNERELADGSWQVDADELKSNSGDIYLSAPSGPLGDPQTSAEANFDAVQALVNQAGHVLKANIDNHPFAANAPRPLDINTEH